MFDLVDFMNAGILCGLLTVYILLFKKNALRSYSDFVLSASILCQIWAVLLFLFVFSGSIQQFPYFYRTAAPLTFLVPPLGYLYVRSVLYNERKWQTTDYLHLLPHKLLAFFLKSIRIQIRDCDEDDSGQELWH